MRSEIFLRRKSLLADIASLFVFGRFGVLSFDVLFEMLLSDESLFAVSHIALMRFMFRVVACDVKVQVIDSREALVTDRALDSAFFMSKLVTFEMSRSGEAFTALFAFMELVLGINFVFVFTSSDEGVHVTYQIFA
jgi:hypothetical protein